MINKILEWVFGKSPTVENTAPERATVKAAPPTAPVVETTTLTVKAKYKKAELNKMSKKALLNLATTHGLEVKARVTKDELVKLLSKV